MGGISPSADNLAGSLLTQHGMIDKVTTYSVERRPVQIGDTGREGGIAPVAMTFSKAITVPTRMEVSVQPSGTNGRRSQRTTRSRTSQIGLRPTADVVPSAQVQDQVVMAEVLLKGRRKAERQVGTLLGG